jgi:hypothetical protein
MPQSLGIRSPSKTYEQADFPFKTIALTCVAGFCVSLAVPTMSYLILILTICGGGLLFSKYLQRCARALRAAPPRVPRSPQTTPSRRIRGRVCVCGGGGG